MKAFAAVLVTLLLGAGAAEAGWVPTKKLPKPIDYPVVRPKLKETHKQGKRANHPPSFAYRIQATGTANS
jgi:hypothetical protein